MCNALKKIKDALPIILFTALLIYFSFHIVRIATSGNKLFLVKKDTVSIYQTATGYFFKDEYVITSSADGAIEYFAENGEKIPSGYMVATYREAGEIKEIVSACSGYFYKEVDGCEAIMTIENASKLTLDNFDTVTGISNDENTVKNAVGKVMTEYHFLFACKVPYKSDYVMGNEYEITFSDVTVPMTLVKFETGKGETLLVFECSRVPIGKTLPRYAEATIKTSEIIGDSVPTRAIHTKNRLKYVYIFDNGFARQYRVNVLYSDSETALVECVPSLEGKLVVVDDYLYDGKVLK